MCVLGRRRRGGGEGTGAGGWVGFFSETYIIIAIHVPREVGGCTCACACACVRVCVRV